MIKVIPVYKFLYFHLKLEIHHLKAKSERDSAFEVCI